MEKHCMDSLTIDAPAKYMPRFNFYPVNLIKTNS